MNTSAIRVVRADQFDRGTAQTPGSERHAAIAAEVGVTSAIWGGLFEVEPGSRTGIHHHGNQETIAYVLFGTCEIRWGERGAFSARAMAECDTPLVCARWRADQLRSARAARTCAPVMGWRFGATIPEYCAVGT